MNYQHLVFSVEDRIATLQIHRPDKMNALNRELLDELAHAVQQVQSDPGIRAALLTGSGEKAFAAGADIAEFSAFRASEGGALAEKGQRIFQMIENCPKPFLAAVNGYALGGGCELAMACHIRWASDQARFGQPEISLGLIPGYGGTQRLTALVGKAKALELMLSGSMMDAGEALSFGLVSKVLPLAELLPAARALLKTIAEKSPLAVERILNCVRVHEQQPADGFAAEAEAFGDCFDTEDAREGIQAFLQKRQPQFRGK